MSVEDINRIGLKKAFLKYKFDLLNERRIEYEEKITHDVALISIGVGAIFFSVVLLIVTSLLSR